MGMKQRVVVLRLRDGGFLSKTGKSTSCRPVKPVQFKWEDGLRFLQVMRPSDRNDILWGASIEMLEKRKTWMPLNEQEFTEFLVTMKTNRLLTKAEAYDRLAKEYQGQATHYEQRATEMWKKAAEVRASLQSSAAVDKP